MRSCNLGRHLTRLIMGSQDPWSSCAPIMGSIKPAVSSLVHERQERCSWANTITEAVSFATLKSQSQLIAKHIHPISSTIFRLFGTIIEARRQTQSLFLVRRLQSGPRCAEEQWVASALDKGLLEAFNSVGGASWKEGAKGLLDTPDEDEE